MQTAPAMAYIAAMLAGSFAFGKGIDDVARIEVKSDIAKWLNQVDLSANRAGQLHHLLLATFNDIFSDSIFSKRFFWKSLQFSTLSSLAITAIAYFFMKTVIKESSPAIRLLENPSGIIVATVSVLLAAIFCDYLSLAKSSTIINSKNFYNSPFSYYFLDLIITALMSLTWILILALIIANVGASQAIDKQPNNLMNLMVYGLFSSITMLAPTVVTLTFVLALYFARLLILFGKPLQLLKISILDIDNKPFTSIAILSWPLVLLIGVFSIWVAS